VATSPPARASGGKKKEGVPKPVRPRRDFEALKQRRLRAAEMFGLDKSQAEVARALGVSAQAVSEWYRVWRSGGRAALAGAGRAGRVPRLSDEQLADVVTALKEGPRANGFGTDLWTLARVADLIERVTGIRLGQTQTWDTLRRRLGWTRQRPARRALERDDAAIANWVEVEWPRIKGVPADGGRGSSSKTSRGSRSSPR
jgi:transposase